MLQKDILITFYNRGLRSYIDLDLCADCPRQDDKGCCGYYSPVFYPSDFAYLLDNNPSIIDYILSIPDITILDASVTVNNSIDGDSYRCHFHRKESGCILPQAQRESVCRHFVCPGIKWEEEAALQHWKQFFDQLEAYEIELNNTITAALTSKGLTLRNPDTRKVFFTELKHQFARKTRILPEFFTRCPSSEQFLLHRQIKTGKEWPL